MKPYYQDELVTLYHSDCIELMRSLPDDSVHAVVTDPPYGLEFMGREWDSFKPSGSHVEARSRRSDEMSDESKRPFIAPGVNECSAGLPFQIWCAEWATEALRVLKPGGFMLAFGGSRTWHRLAVAVEDAGFEIRDSIAWLYGSGFPKSMDVSKAIDKAAGAERGTPTSRNKTGDKFGFGGGIAGRHDATWICDACGKSRGSQSGNCRCDLRGEPVTAAAAGAAGWGTALKPAFEPIVVGRKPFKGTTADNFMEHGTGAINIDGCRVGDEVRVNEPMGSPEKSYGGYGATATAGRWPTNVVLDESQAAALDAQTGYGASGFFPIFRYEAKAPGTERPDVDGTQHPTVKPLDLMRWLVRLVTPAGGTVLEPFAGSGTTLEAALIEGFHVIGVEREATYLPLIMQRITKPLQQSLFGEELA